MGRFGGILKNVFKGVVQGIGEGTVGQGGIMRGIAENIQAERTGIAQPSYGTTRAAPGRQLDFSQALDNPPPDPVPDPYIGPNYFVNTGDTWASGGDVNMVTPNTHVSPEPPVNPRPTQRPRIDDQMVLYDNYDGLGPDDDSDLLPPVAGQQQGYNQTTTMPEFMGPLPQGHSSAVYPSGTYGTQSGTVMAGAGACSCKPKRTCAEKCAYDEQMKMQCKPCRAYFRRTKKYIYPKRKRYARRSYPRRKTYRRRKSQTKTSSYNTRKAGYEAGFWAGLRSGQMGPIR